MAANEATIFRILGNQMPPRDTVGKRDEILKYILEEEPELEGAQKWFIVNRIQNIMHRRCICELLDRANAHYVVIPFDKSVRPNPDALSMHGVAINSARNYAIEAGHVMTPWSVVLDGDCVFDKQGWAPVLEAMRKGNTPHISIPHRRESQEDVYGEPMLAFHRSSGKRFDESLRFGHGDKLRLLFELGHDQTPSSGHLEITGNLTQLAGYTTHRATGEISLESDLVARERARRNSFQWLASRMKNWPQMHLTYKGQLANFHEKVDGYFDYSGFYSSLAFDALDGSEVVEVGSWQGKSTIYLANQFKAFGKRAHIHCVDTFDGGTDEVIQKRVKEMGGPDVAQERFQENLRRAQVGWMVTTHRKPSVEAASDFQDDSMAAVFIDADHSYEAVKADLAAWYPKVKPGGIIAGHDFVWNHPVSQKGVIRAVREFCADKPLEVMRHGRIWKSVKYGDVEPSQRKRSWC